MGDKRCRDHRAGPWPIFDDDRLPKPLADALGRKSGDQVIRAAGPKSDDPADWMVRPFRTRRRRGEPANKDASGKNYRPIYHYFLLPSRQSLVPGLPRINIKAFDLKVPPSLLASS
jgi:hypothetical protein